MKYYTKSAMLLSRRRRVARLVFSDESDPFAFREFAHKEAWMPTPFQSFFHSDFTVGRHRQGDGFDEGGNWCFREKVALSLLGYSCETISSSIFFVLMESSCRHCVEAPMN